MKVNNPRVTQFLYYLLLIEFIFVIVSVNNKPIIGVQIMRWVLIATAAIFIFSIVYFLWNRKKPNSKQNIVS
jgi:hypothetical protein